MATFETMRDVFYSGPYAFSGDLEPINEITFLVDNGYMMCEKVLIATKKAYVSILEDTATLQGHGADGGGLPHIALKMLAAEYVRREGYEIKYEHPFCGYVPDAMTQDNSIVIECGHIQNPEKMFAYFRQGTVRECIQIPYPTDESTGIIGYRFAAGKNLNDFLMFLEAKKREKVKNLIQNKDAKH